MAASFEIDCRDSSAARHAAWKPGGATPAREMPRSLLTYVRYRDCDCGRAHEFAARRVRPALDCAIRRPMAIMLGLMSMLLMIMFGAWLPARLGLA